MFVFLSYRKNFVGTQKKRVQIRHGKRAIDARVIEVNCILIMSYYVSSNELYGFLSFFNKCADIYHTAVIREGLFVIVHFLGFFRYFLRSVGTVLRIIPTLLYFIVKSSAHTKDIDRTK